MKKTPIIPIKIIKELHDTDWDGVPNYRDCQIFNPHKQHNIFQKEPIRKKEVLLMNGTVSVDGFYYKKLKKIVKKHEKKGKKRRSNSE